MKIAILSVSETGFLLAQKIKNRICDEENLQVVLGVKSQFELQNNAYIKESLAEYVAKIFYEVDGIVFISATGIALRMIAPLIEKKQKDPAIVVVDETGKFCISLLSGHLGGANKLTERIANACDAIPVITTATDRQEKFAVDNFAKENGLSISDFSIAKEISSAILHGEKIDVLLGKTAITKAFFTNYDELGIIDSIEEGKANYCIYIGNEEDIEIDKCKGNKVLYLTPMKLAVGIGCRRNTEEEKIDLAIRKCLKEHGYFLSQVETLSSIDLKKEEAGIINFCKKNKLSFVTYSTEELEKVTGSESTSDFVKQITGVDNVCERAALCCGSELVVKKSIYDGVTIAIARI